jgi:hypothetical protein
MATGTYMQRFNDPAPQFIHRYLAIYFNARDAKVCSDAYDHDPGFFAALAASKLNQ